ncbi:MAG: amidohydrolase family protein [Pseudolabrys sp.]|nr:amidohydrolase family protein [Pseudolabrys sp.]
MPAVLGVTHTAPNFDVPRNACDCHVHVFEPAFPYTPVRGYTPAPATLNDLKALHAALHIDRVVIVHPSVYGTDNACTVDAVRKLNGRARGVAVIDKHTTDAALADMNEAGIRGVRINLGAIGESDPAVAKRYLTEAAARVAPLGWHVQTFASLPVLSALRDTIADLPTTLVVDHFASADAALGPDQPGLDAIYDLLRSGKIYIKVAAGYRWSKLPGYADVAPLARALIAANVDRILWGTDWPHPGGGQGKPITDFTAIEPFIAVDDGFALNRLNEWCGDRVTLEKVLVTNPARLYGF